MMEPRLIARVTASDGTVRSGFEPRTAMKVLTDPAVAATIRDYMHDTVNAAGGTGHAAALHGWNICGKTGSAEIDGQARTNALFIGFIDDEQAPYAVSIVLENAGSGGAYPASLAHDIFEYLVEHLQNVG